MSTKNTALQIAVLRLLLDKVKQASDAAKANGLGRMDPGDRITATYNGQKIAAVSAAEGKTSARVTNPDALAAWVAEHYPTEVEHKPVIRPAFERVLLDLAKKAGEPVAPDGELDVPGIAVSNGDPYITVRPTPEAEQIVTAMLAAGVLDVDGTIHELHGSAAA
ncbi:MULTISPECIES: hypothetical protein [unclassified Saccharopolyspora]|uniref:hypothetical protein n=1 Tax=unclassified Saccharopolyspora TaxID=2646250 RepID=UPI001CD53EC7|nr:MULTISPECIES: hypothetical protein [unclassified Saccharopolyspora]MCA1185791.1 hypothetical protein [Saccharopolyspora sp. 6T]MCA1191703.1 hypothetical protein [Saccharopolyspora sp. 6V]